MEFLQKVKIEVVVESDKYEDMIKAIIDAACTGKIEDKILISPIDSVVDIRTGQSDKTAF